MTRDHYILDDDGTVKIVDLMTWGLWLETSGDKGIVGKDQVGDVQVSTVFLGLDHNFGDGPPLIFETMIFGGKHDQYQERYATKDEAIEGHKTALALVVNE